VPYKKKEVKARQQRIGVGGRELSNIRKNLAPTAAQGARWYIPALRGAHIFGQFSLAQAAG
jgi:hypothetical protein